MADTEVHDAVARQVIIHSPNPLTLSPEDLHGLGVVIQDALPDVVVEIGGRPPPKEEYLCLSLWEVVQVFLPVLGAARDMVIELIIARFVRWSRRRFWLGRRHTKSLTIYGPDNKPLRTVTIRSWAGKPRILDANGDPVARPIPTALRCALTGWSRMGFRIRQLGKNVRMAAGSALSSFTSFFRSVPFRIRTRRYRLAVQKARDNPRKLSALLHPDFTEIRRLVLRKLAKCYEPIGWYHVEGLPDAMLAPFQFDGVFKSASDPTSKLIDIVWVPEPRKLRFSAHLGIYASLFARARNYADKTGQHVDAVLAFVLPTDTSLKHNAVDTWCFPQEETTANEEWSFTYSDIGYVPNT